MKTETKQNIESLINHNPILLFMKGSKERPQCGFSKQVVEVLNQLVSDFTSVDVLADPEMREGIKVFSSWPTIPQLYVNGEFIGGCDIVLDLFQKNQLQEILKLEKAVTPPHVELTERAKAAFLEAQQEQTSNDLIRISVSQGFEHALSFDQKTPNDFVLTFGELSLLIDPYSAKNANNLKIDFLSDNLEAGFAFTNPNEPPAVKEISASELKSWHDQRRDALLIDVRPKNEWDIAHISFAKPLSEINVKDLNKESTIVFHCHHGRRSMQMAERFRAQGFKNLYNLTGGIHAWSQEVDKSVPTY